MVSFISTICTINSDVGQQIIKRFDTKSSDGPIWLREQSIRGYYQRNLAIDRSLIPITSAFLIFPGWPFPSRPPAANHQVPGPQLHAHLLHRQEHDHSPAHGIQAVRHL